LLLFLLYFFSSGTCSSWKSGIQLKKPEEEANFGLAARKGYPTMDELKAFAKVRLPRKFDKKGNPTYDSLGKLKK